MVQTSCTSRSAFGSSLLGEFPRPHDSMNWLARSPAAMIRRMARP